MAQMSKRVVARLHNARYVISSVEQHGETIAAALAQALPQLGEEGAREVLGALAGRLGAASERLQGLEQRYVDEQANDPAALQARDEAVEALTGALVELRGYIRQGAPDRLASLGLAASLPTQPDALVSLGRDAARLMQQARPSVVESALGMTLNLAAAGARLGEQVEALEGAIARVQREGRALEAARVERDGQLEVWEQVYRAVCNTLVGLYQLAGRNVLAGRIRPTRRKARGERLIDEEETAAASDDASSRGGGDDEAGAEAASDDKEAAAAEAPDGKEA